MRTDDIAPAPRRHRRFLAPLATLVAAGALLVGSGANFTSESTNVANLYAAGSLTQANSKSDTAIFAVTNLKPGDTVNGDVTITNTGTLPAVFSLTEAATNGFKNPANLQLSVTQGATTIYSGTFGALGTRALGAFAPGEVRTYRFSTTLSSGAGNDEQNMQANAAYTWNATQTEAVTVEQPTGTVITAPAVANR
jgi:spore coat-associated protein N